MPRFSKRSRQRLATCHKDLQLLCNEVIKDIDITILCGHRSQKDQNAAFEGGFSKVKWPNSKHNAKPSNAVDCAPFPIDWDDHKRFDEMGAKFKEVAKAKGINIKWGGDWKSIVDKPHIELTEEKSCQESQGLLGSLLSFFLRFISRRAETQG